MTEMSDKCGSMQPWPPFVVRMTGGHPVDPVAFAVALVAAPLAVAGLGFWAVVPVFAVGFGAPSYLTFGALFLFLALHLGGGGAGRLALWASAANLASVPAVWAVLHAGYERSAADAWTETQFIVRWGIIFAPLWGLAFGLLYQRFRRDFYGVSKEGEH